MTAVYATRADLDDFGGLPDGSLANPGREVASCLATTDTIELDAHGLQTDDEVTFRAIDGTLSAPLVAGTVYYAIRLSDSTFKVAATAGGSAINITTDGVNMYATKPLPIDRMLELYSRWVDGFLPAHVVPLTSPYPIVVVAVVASLAGKALLNLDGKSSDVIDKAEMVAMAQLKRWSDGIPLRDSKATAPANLAVTVAAGTLDPRGWGSSTLP